MVNSVPACKCKAFIKPQVTEYDAAAISHELSLVIIYSALGASW